MPEITYQDIETRRSQNLEGINDLIGNPPGWLLRSGIGMIALVSITIISATYFIRYPDKLVSVGIMTSDSPPIEVVSRASGYIDQIFVENGEYVEQGAPIMYINNTTNPEELEVLEDWIYEFKQIRDPREYLHLRLPRDLQLGTVQADYSQLGLEFDELQTTLKNGVVFQQINNLTREIVKIRNLNQSREREKGIYKQELELAEKDFERNKYLLNEGVVSELDLEKVKTIVLQKERQYEGMNNTIIQNNIRIEQLSLEKLRLQQERSEKIKQYQFAIAGIIANIKSKISAWSDTYIVQAPLDGTLSYNSNVAEKRPVAQGDLLTYIMPEQSDGKYAVAQLPVANSGKLERGQKAILKFDAYPHKEFGSVISKVGNISRIPEQDKEGNMYYEVKIPLEEIIVTDYNDTIPYKPNMLAQVEIITEDRSIFDRIFDQFLSLMNTQ